MKKRKEGKESNAPLLRFTDGPLFLPLMKRRDVWWVYFDPSIGHVIEGFEQMYEGIRQGHHKTGIGELS
jgi:hypothetical protein